MIFTRDLLEDLYLQIIDGADGKAVPAPDLYTHIGKNIKELDGLTFASNKDANHEFNMRYVADTDQLSIFAEDIKEIVQDDEQSPTTSQVEETTGE